MRTLLRPTGFVDSPFGHDGKVARLAGGLNWFSQVELIHPDGGRELVAVEGIDGRLDEAMRGDWTRLTCPRAPLQLGPRTIRLDQPQVMGIINATPDSFSDGGQYADARAAAEAGAAMAAAGAALIDVGGESTRPGAKPVWEGDEIERVLPVIQQLAASGTAVAIDTRKAAVMEAAIGAGAGVVNDVSALNWDPRSADVIAAAEAPVILMHHQGEPETMQDAPRYGDVLVEVFEWLETRVAVAQAAGIAREKILVDPGIGFGKSVAHNLELLNGLALFHGLGCGIVVGASRKRMIGALANEAPPDQRLGGSLALALKAVEQGAQVVRVHDVPETVQAFKIWRGLRDQALTPRV
ncbi:MAG: dihydropteroate synthase [Sphingomicrobium sp.]